MTNTIADIARLAGVSKSTVSRALNDSPLIGVETIAVYADDRYLNAHLYAARYAYRRTQAARFSALNIGVSFHNRATLLFL